MSKQRLKTAKFRVGQVVRTQDWKGEPWLGVVTKAYYTGDDDGWQYHIERDRKEILVQGESELRSLTAREKGEARR